MTVDSATSSMVAFKRYVGEAFQIGVCSGAKIFREAVHLLTLACMYSKQLIL